MTKQQLAEFIYKWFDEEPAGYVGDFRFQRGSTTLDGEWDLDDLAQAILDKLKENAK